MNVKAVTAEMFPGIAGKPSTHPGQRAFARAVWVGVWVLSYAMLIAYFSGHWRAPGPTWLRDVQAVAVWGLLISVVAAHCEDRGLIGGRRKSSD